MGSIPLSPAEKAARQVKVCGPHDGVDRNVQYYRPFYKPGCTNKEYIDFIERIGPLMFPQCRPYQAHFRTWKFLRELQKLCLLELDRICSFKLQGLGKFTKTYRAARRAHTRKSPDYGTMEISAIPGKYIVKCVCEFPQEGFGK